MSSRLLSIPTDPNRFRKLAREGRIATLHAPRAVAIAAASDTTEMRETTVRRAAGAGRMDAEITTPLGGQAAGLFYRTLLGPDAASGERRTLGAAAQTVRKDQRALTAEVFVFCAKRRVGRKFRFQQGVVDGLAVALQLQSETRGRGRKGQARDAHLSVLNLCAQLQRHATAGLFSELLLGLEREDERERTRTGTFPVEQDVIAPTLSERRVKLECHGARARSSARAQPDHTDDG